MAAATLSADPLTDDMRHCRAVRSGSRRELAERLEPTHVFDPSGVGQRAIKVELPEHLKAYEEKAVFCENKANELLSAAATARLRETKLALLDVSEQWMTLALYYRTKLREAEKDQS